MQSCTLHLSVSCKSWMVRPPPGHVPVPLSGSTISFHLLWYPTSQEAEHSEGFNQFPSTQSALQDSVLHSAESLVPGHFSPPCSEG